MVDINSIINEIIKPLLHENNVVEAKNVGALYHFTNFNGLSNILDSDTFKGSEANVDKDDLDFKSFKMDAESLKDKGIYSLYFFSTTRDKLIYKKDPKIKGSTVRIVLDGDKLSNKYQISPFYFYHDEMVDEPNPKYSQDESEERIMLGTKKVISDASNYIKEIDILLDKIEDNQEYLDAIQRLIEKYGDKIKCLYKEKPMSLNTYIKTILPTIEPFRYKEEEEDIPEQQVKSNINELQPSEIKYWAVHSDVFDALKKDSDYERVYNYLKNKLTGEKLEALEYFYNEYFLDPRYPIKESLNAAPTTFDEAVKSLTKYMVDQGMNIEPLPRTIIISNDSENAENILGKTAYYNPNNCSITLYTLNRHPKDILRSYAHEMIHRMQDNEGILNNINTTNTNEDDSLEELEKEAYLKGNITFRNWEDSIKNPKPLNEWIIESDLPKFNPPALLTTDLVTQLYKLKINEILLNPNNAAEIEGDVFSGKFKVGDLGYTYSISKFPNPYKDGDFYNINFDEIGNKNSNLQTGKAGGKNYIKILSTMYKIILNFVSKEKPNYIGISNIEGSGYGNVYNDLTKTNKLPGYSRKDAKVNFITKDSENRNINGSFVVLKKVQSGESESLNEGRYDTISNRTSSMIFNKWKQDFEKGKKQGKFKTLIKNDDVEFDLDATIKFTNSGEPVVDGGLEETEDGFTIFVDFEVNKNDLPQKWSEVSMGLKDVIRHEVEHITQANLETSKFMEDDQLIRGLVDAKLLPPAQYFKLEKEVDANLQGMYFRAKKEKKPFIDVINDYLNKQDITPEQKEEILTLWRSRAKALSLPKF